MTRECPKCHYERHVDDTAPAWQCPRCGVAYHKYREGGPPGPLAARPRKGAVTKRARFRQLRILLLLLVLFLVALDTWLTKLRTTDWDQPLRIVIYPINADGSAEAADYITGLHRSVFVGVDDFIRAEATRYALPLSDPIDIDLGPVVASLPPALPPDRNIFKVMWWSLKLRLWANEVDDYRGASPDIRIFVQYHKLEDDKPLGHSTGLEKGMICVVNAFASERMADRNNVVIAHELLHTLGASDKYDLHSGLPLYPDGYADPRQQPRYPQLQAEIMGGKVALSEFEARMPASLEHTVIGPATAMEIGWLE